jgi:hypothetical protein
MIKAIFFDWGWTFVKGFEHGEREINKILKPLGLNWRDFRFTFRKFYILRSAGKIRNDKEFESIIQRVAQKKVPVKEIIKFSIETQIIPKEHIEIVKKLKKITKQDFYQTTFKNGLPKLLKIIKLKIYLMPLSYLQKLEQENPMP